MRAFLVLLVVGLIIMSSCQAPMTPTQARAQAQQTGCWAYGVPQPANATPQPSTTSAIASTTSAIAPTIVVYPTCVPQIGTPTVTPTTTPRPTYVPHATPVSVVALTNGGGAAILGDGPGRVTNMTADMNATGRAIAAWTHWGWMPSALGQADGQVWVRAQLANGAWGQAQTVNTAAVSGGIGAVGVAWGATNTATIAWGDGSDATWVADSIDGGQTWGDPVQINAGYQVLRLVSDSHGGMHLLTLTSGPHQVKYSYRAPDSTSWTTHALREDGEHFIGTLAVLDLPNGGVRRFASYTTDVGTPLRLMTSDDGQSWRDLPVHLGRYRVEDAPDFPDLLAVNRPSGPLVMLVWSQWSKSGVFAQTSLDGGQTWGDEEQIFRDLIDGYRPHLVYDSGMDAIGVAVREVLRGHEPPARVRFAGRRITDDHWTFAATPETGDVSAPVLIDWGDEGTLSGSASGNAAYVLRAQRMHAQWRVTAEPFSVATYLSAEVS